MKRDDLLPVAAAVMVAALLFALFYYLAANFWKGLLVVLLVSLGGALAWYLNFLKHDGARTH